LEKSEQKLPVLPLPELNHLRELAEWVKPLVDEEDFRITMEALESFLEPDGDGERLQQQLKKIASQTSTSWLAPLWWDLYLAYRGPLVGHMNYSGMMETASLPSGDTVSALGGKMVHELMKVYEKISLCTFPQGYVKDRPLCMDQYQYLFKAHRLPKPDKDQYITYPMAAPHHIVVLYRDAFYRLNTSDDHGEIFSSSALASGIQRILEAQKKAGKITKTEGDRIGALTTATRKEAALTRQELEVNEVNRKNLEAIDQAIFVLCIDPTPATIDDWHRSLLLSEGNNRYFDKSFQLILSESLDIGFNAEHTGADATPWFHFMEQLHQTLQKSREAEPDHSKPVGEPIVEKLEWKFSHALKQRLQKQREDHLARAAELELTHLFFQHFGKEQIKQLKMSPDAFFHIALQTAQYSTFGKLKSTYESVSVRHFKAGRTECARPVNREVALLAKAMQKDDQSSEWMKSQLRKAQDAHLNRIMKCQQGYGIERHLFGLQKMYEQHGERLGISKEPGLFSTPGYRQLKHDFLSSSGVGSESISLFSFGPVTEDGFGIGYVIRQESIHVSLSCKSENRTIGTKLLKELEAALLKQRQILLGTAKINLV